jgi:hypothetical protein
MNKAECAVYLLIELIEALDEKLELLTDIGISTKSTEIFRATEAIRHELVKAEQEWSSLRGDLQQENSQDCEQSESGNENYGVDSEVCQC